MGRSSKVAIWVWSPRLRNSKLLVPVTVASKRRQREHNTQRSASSMIGPRSTTLRFWTFSSGSILRVVEPVLHVLVLQVALAGLVADRAVDGVVDEQELEGRAVGLGRLRRSGCCTTMPSETVVLQAICSFGIFSISTRHMRQLPSMGRSGCQQKWGISIPSCDAAWMTVVPAATSISFPSILILGITGPARRR